MLNSVKITNGAGYILVAASALPMTAFVVALIRNLLY